MSLILALAMLGQPSAAGLSPDEIAALAASYHRAAWEANGRPTTAQIAARFNAEQAAQRENRKPPTPIPMAELERRAWIGWLGQRYGLGPLLMRRR